MHKKEDDSMKTIGVFSYQGHTGVTHLALLLASYFSSKQGRKVWYFEVGNQYTVESIPQVIKGRYIGTQGEFQVDKITFFPNISIEKALKLVDKTPDLIIMDFGKINKEKEALLRLCKDRILIINGILWKQGVLNHIFSQKTEKNDNLWTRCMCFLGRGHLKFSSVSIKEEICIVPEIKNPLFLKREDIKKIVPLVQKQD